MAKTKQVETGGNVIVIKMNEHKVPQFREVMGKDWIYFGKNNDYPDYLLTLYNRSAKHNAIINAKAFYIFGHGSEAGAEFKVNEDGETLDDVLKKIILDYELFGGFALEVIWSFGGKLAEIRHVNFSHVRSNEDNTRFYHTKEWSKCYYDDFDNETRLPNYSPQDNKDWVTWDAFNPEEKKGKQLYYYKCYRPELDTYPLPDYIGANPYIETDFEISNYWYNAVKNGFTASHIITFYGDPGTQEEQKKLEERITKKFTGTDRAGKIILNFSQNKEKGGSEISNIVPQDLDKQFQILNETVQQEIFSGHRITSPMLFGIKTPGQLGGRTEMIEAYQLFQNTYVAPKQKMFDKVFTNLSALMGLKKPIELQKLEPIGIDVTTNMNAWSMLDEQEKREAIGRKPYTPAQKAERKAEQDRKDAQAQAANKFNSMKTIPIDIFKKYSGAPRKGKLLASRQLEWEHTLDLKASEHGFARQYFAQLRQKQLAVLDLLVKNPLEPPDRIAEALTKIGLQTSTEEVNNIITFLKKKDLLEESKAKSGDGDMAITVRELTPVKDAVKILENTPAPTANIFTVYSYEFRPPFTEEEDSDTMRDFCAELMAESKQREAAGNLWSREEIEQMENESDMSVWASRGGWYTKPGTDIHFPHCRHIWVQHLYTLEE